MFSVQYSLPRLPVPALQQTLDKFLLSVKPQLSEEEYAHAEKVGHIFCRAVVDNKILFADTPEKPLFPFPTFFFLGFSTF